MSLSRPIPPALSGALDAPLGPGELVWQGVEGGGAAPLLTPADLGAISWYNGDSIEDTAGVVTNWADTIGSADFSSVVGTPEVATGAGGARYIDFDGIGDRLDMGAAVAWVRPLTLAFLFRQDTTASNSYLLVNGATARGAIFVTSNDSMLINDGSADVSTGAGAVVDEAINKMIIVFPASGNNELIFNGVTYNSGLGIGSEIGELVWNLFGRNNGTNWTDGGAYDLAVFDKILSAGELASLDAYMNSIIAAA